MIQIRLFAIACLLGSGLALGQTGELSIVHGLPGLAAPVDVLIDGVPTFTNLSFGDETSTNMAPGGYAVDFVDGASLVMSGFVIVSADQRSTVAIHLTIGGFPFLSTFQDDRTPVLVAGNARVRLRHLADANFLATLSNTGPATSFNFLLPQLVLEIESPANPYEVTAVEVDLSITPVTINLNGPSSGLLPLAADEDLTINIVGTPDTPSFGYIVQRQNLIPSTPLPPASPDLSISGSLIGSTIDVGGVIDFSLTGCAPNATTAVFVSIDNDPQPISPGVMFGIGGQTGMFALGVGVADVFGTSFGSYWFPGFPVELIGVVETAYVQGVSVDFLGQGLSQIGVSDIETFTIGT